MPKTGTNTHLEYRNRLLTNNEYTELINYLFREKDIMEDKITLLDIGTEQIKRERTEIAFDNSPFIEPSVNKIDDIYKTMRDILYDRSKTNSQWKDLVSIFLYAINSPHSLDILTGRFRLIKGSSKIIPDDTNMVPIYKIAQIFRNESTIFANLDSKVRELSYINKKSSAEDPIPDESKEYLVRYTTNLYIGENNIIRKLINRDDILFIFLTIFNKVNNFEQTIDIDRLIELNKRLTFIYNIRTYRMIFKPEKNEYVHQTHHYLRTRLTQNDVSTSDTPIVVKLASYLMLIIGKILDQWFEFDLGLMNRWVTEVVEVPPLAIL